MNNRLLGVLAIVCTPAMLLELWFDPNATRPVIVGLASMVFMLGSFASHVGLWRVGATGTRWYGRAPLLVQLVLVGLAFLFGLIEMTSALPDDNLLFMITDIAWPLSMVWMNITGIAALVARRLPLPQRFAPLLCGLAFPGTMALSLAMGIELNSQISSTIFFVMLMVFWALLGLAVMTTDRPHRRPITADTQLEGAGA